MATLEDTLQQSFGLASFRAWQREAIQALIDGPRRVLLVAPTGGGKSLCYQLPAVVLGGTTVVISPLIALMEDQVRSLNDRGIPATYLASTLDIDERRQREDRLLRGAYTLVYVAPERLRTGAMVSLLRRLAPPLVAVDEAHCISQWGHDFRPDYLRIGEAIRDLRPPRVLACTATATPAVRGEIMDRLSMPADTRLVLRGFARPNLHLAVEEVDKLSDRRRLAVREVQRALGSPAQPAGAAIVYAGTRKNSEAVARLFSDAGWRSGAYHAGLDAAVRERVSASFAAGDLDVVVATNAFGMGIDRPDIRVVAHVQAPGSIEQYYQEVGRAGRDGLPAHGILMRGTDDYAFRKRLIAGSGDGHDDAYRDRQWGLFLDLMRYAEAGSCRHDFILRYFEDEHEVLGGCGHCDVCAQVGDGASPAVALSDDDRLTVRKALAGVARLRRRAGLTALAASLHGTDSERVRKLGLDRLSTHGILSAYSEEWILALLRRLMTAALVDVTAGDFPVPFLTPQGVAVMKEQAPVRVIPPPHRAWRRIPKKASAASSVPDADRDLFEALKRVRSTRAKERGVAPFVVAHDRTLAEIAAQRPRNLADLERIHGMGPSRVDAYGDSFLAVVAEHA